MSQPRPRVTAADYAAIGVAPLLIFVMLSALVHFLLLMIYHGGYSARVAWITLMVTMGMVAGARLGIEEGRQRSMMYLGVLAIAGVFVLTKFVGSIAVAVLLVGIIGVLADRIVADCTIIDESIDASGRGLIDLEGRRGAAEDGTNRTQRTNRTRRADARRGHQPGRTVLYLAAAALPLFGIGQFGLSESAGVRGRWLLTAYLFASLSLLVVTAFLNLRRYLRQRGTEMSTRTTVSWLAGGIAAIAVILTVAWLAPLPGRAIANFQTPGWLASVESFSPSDWGWGDEGAGEQPQPDGTAGAPQGQTPKQPPESTDNESQPGSPAEVNADAAPGNDGAAQAGSGGAASRETAEGGKAPPAESSESGEASGGSGGDKSSDESSSDISKESGASQPGEPPGGSEGEKQSGGESSEGQEPDASNEAPSESSKPPRDDQEKSPAGEDTPPQPSDDADGEAAETETSQAAEDQAAEDQTADQAPPSGSPPPSPPASNPLSGLFDLLGGMLRWLFFAALVVGGAWWFYANREAIAAWWRSLLTGEEPPRSDPGAEPSRRRGGTPPRPFSDFRNPMDTQPPEEAIIITFEALQAWGREHRLPPRPGETPDEYVRRVAGQHPAIGQSAAVVVDAYNRVLYGRRAGQNAGVTRRELAAGQRVWASMGG